MQRHQKLLFVGLGNIGEPYKNTRHNIGFDILDLWAEKHKLSWSVERLASVCFHKIRGVQICVIKPSTFMNLSGSAVKYWMNKEKISIQDILVIVDDLAFDLGTIKLRMQGSHGGHNGLRNIQEELQSYAYAKLRCGIGKEFPIGRQSDFVLGKWTSLEQPKVEIMMEKVLIALEKIVSSNLILAMNEVNI